MNKLEEKLLAIGKVSTDESEGLLKETKLMLDNNAAEERSTLASIGLDNEIRYMENKQADLIIRKNGKEQLEKEVLHLDDIRSFCKTYRLVMKPAQSYAGSIPPELGAELNRFTKEKNVPLPSHSSYSNFYVIAPPKMFVNYMTPLQVAAEALELHNEKARERRKRIWNLMNDPILVYELPHSPGYYAIIKSWGNDFTLLREFYGLVTSNMKAVWALVNVSLGWILFRVGLWQYNWFDNIHAGEKLGRSEICGWTIIGGFMWVVLVIMYCIWLFPFDDFRKHISKKVSKRIYSKNE